MAASPSGARSIRYCPRLPQRIRRPLVRLLTLLFLIGCVVAATAVSRAVWTHYTLAAAARRLKAAVPLKPSAGGARYLPILIPVSDRPHYMAQMVDGLRKVEGIGETVLVFSQDGSNKEVTRLIKVQLVHRRRPLVFKWPAILGAPGTPFLFRVRGRSLFPHAGQTSFSR